MRDGEHAIVGIPEELPNAESGYVWFVYVCDCLWFVFVCGLCYVCVLFQVGVLQVVQVRH